jgi:hypothetical protein
LHLAPRTTNPAATNSATTNLETRSYHPTLPIPPLPISQFATTCCIFNCVHTLIGIFHAPRASRYQSRRYQSRRNQSRRYQSRNLQLPPRATNPPATNPAPTNLATRNYLPSKNLCPYPTWNIPRTFRPVPTNSRLQAHRDELVSTDSRLPAAAATGSC